ncbi:Uncharacterized protein TPAR_04398 [Tolypocladium paradoxum]|uniref:Uncharacterized protein n=1 Tax=Tolypocladium paradoxum TaxID=94208 RepID=A0A2S4KYX7_9HYPO|nr:Uncharacterized protein TPAR_04398 [Tolypocladium paradoxum]
MLAAQRHTNMAASRRQPRPSADRNTSGEDEQAPEPPTLYRLVVTPLAFISFLLSLVLVDLHYSLVRLRSHAQAPSRLPPWLHALLFRPRPYESLRHKHRGPSSSRQLQGGTEWHYHSNQRRLMEMEAAEAFEIRSRVLVVLALAAAGGTGATWYAASRLYHHWYP